jgi:hypothetical protein
MQQQELPLLSMPEYQAAHYGRLFGLRPERMRLFSDLSEAQKDRVNYYFGLINAGDYVYAIKSDGGIVSRREARNLFIERSTKHGGK